MAVIINEKLIENLKLSQEVWKSFYEAGLPVAEFKKINLEKDPSYLEKLVKEMNVKFGKLTPCHKNNIPVGLKSLKKLKDEKLIQNLGKDLARTYNLGYYPPKINFWNFYADKKNACTARVIISLDSFVKLEKKDEYSSIYKASLANLKDIQENMGKGEFEIFLNTFLRSVNKKNVKAVKHACLDLKISIR